MNNGLILKQKCARRGCSKAFKPKRDWQKYCSVECKNIAGQERLRERAKRATELEAAHGA